MINIQPPQNITNIYLVENCYGDPNKIYIGKEKSQKLQSRFKDHKKTFGNLINFSYIDQTNSWDKKDWKPLECFWIEQFRQWGFDLQNKNKGGGGPSFRSKETKNKISKAHKGNKYNLGRKQTPEHIENRISKLRGVKEDPKITKIRTNKLRGRKQSQIEKERRAIKLRKKINQYNLDGGFIKEWNSITEASKQLKINFASISACCRGIYNTSGGYKWEYKL